MSVLSMLLGGVVLPATSAGSRLVSGGITVDLAGDGGYSVAIDGVGWLEGPAPTYLPGVAIAEASRSSGRGSDARGNFSFSKVVWEHAGAAVLSTTIAAYDDAEVVAFKQTYLMAIDNPGWVAAAPGVMPAVLRLRWQ